MAEKLDLIFSSSFKDKIWKVQLDEVGKQLALEVRSDRSLEVDFLHLDMDTVMLTPIETPSSDWWSSLVHVGNDKVYIKQFESEGNPQVKEWVIWDISSKKLLDSTQAHKFDKDAKPKSGGIVFYSMASEYFKLLKAFIYSLTGNSNIVAGVEYLEHRGFVFLSYYTGSDNMANYLLVVDMNKNVVIHKRLDKDLKGIGRDTFIVSSNKLIFLQDKQELFIYQLH